VEYSGHRNCFPGLKRDAVLPSQVLIIHNQPLFGYNSFMTRRDFLKKMFQWWLGLQAFFLFKNGDRLRSLFAEIPHPEVPTDLLKASLSSEEGTVLTLEDAAFQTYRWDYNRRIETLPFVIVLCKTPAAVAKALHWAKSHSIPFRPRGGGHSYEGLSLSTGMVLDLSAMNKVVIDPKNQTVRVEAGARLETIHRALSPEGLALPAGSCPTVGIAGLALGGGYGLLSRKWGLTSDHLLAIQMIDADGRRITASTEENPDLFWACRGGGGHFGIVTEFTFRVRPIGWVATFLIRWPTAQAKAVIDAWQRYAPGAADELGCHLTLSAAVGKGVTDLHCGGQVIGKNPEETPTRETVLALLKPLLSSVPPTSISTHVRDFDGAVRYFSGSGDTSPIYFKAKSDYATAPLSTEGIETLLKQLGTLSSGALTLILDAYGGAINRVPAEATAFPHRSALYCLQYYAQWSSPKQTAARMDGLRHVHEAMRPYFSGFAYSNYADADLPNWQHAYYGANYPRLAQIKTVYDPKNVFDLGPQGIRPKSITLSQPSISH
jgi:hypothetical protein